MTDSAGTEFVAPEPVQEEKKEHCTDKISLSQLLKMKGLFWGVGLFVTTAIFVVMSIVAWIGCITSYNDWRYADAGTNKELFRREFLDPRKELMKNVPYRYDLVWYAFARETLNINIVTTILSVAIGYGWLVLFGRRDTKFALQIGYTVSMIGSVVAAFFCLFTKTTFILTAIEVAFAVYMFFRRNSVMESVVGEEESGRVLQTSLEPVQKNPTLLVIPMISSIVEAVIQLSVFACWSFWVSDWKMWFTWILSIWMMDALRMGTLGSMIKALEEIQKDATLSTQEALALATKAFFSILVHDMGSIASLSFLWMPVRLVGEIATMVGGYVNQFLSLAESVARWKSPFATVYISLRDCDSSSAMDASVKLVNNSGVPLSTSPSTIYTSSPAAEYQSLVCNAFRLIGFSLSYLACASCGIPFNVAFWISYMCSGISASLCSPLCTIIDGMLCYTHVNSFRS